MLTIIILILLVIWSMFFTVSRFIKYYRIVNNYRDRAEATVVSTRDHVPGGKREAPAIDVVLEYDIDGKETRSEIIVPASQAASYEVGSRHDICYCVESNGAVHIASAGDGPRRLMYGYLGAIILEIIVYVIIWMIVF